MFGSIPWNPLVANRPEKIVEAERVQREDRKEKSGGERRKFSKKHSGQEDTADQSGAAEKPEQFGKRIDVEA